MAKKNYNKINKEVLVDEEVKVVEDLKDVLEKEVVKKETKVYKLKLVNCKMLNLRKSPNLKSEVLSILNLESDLVFIDEIGEWTKVHFNGKVFGYVMTKFISKV